MYTEHYDIILLSCVYSMSYTYKPQRGLEPFENVKYYNRNLIIFEYLWNRNRCYESTKGIFPCVDYDFDRCKIRYFYYSLFKSFLNYFETSRLNSIWTKTGILKYRAVTEADIFALLRIKVIIKFQSLDAYARVAVSEWTKIVFYRDRLRGSSLLLQQSHRYLYCNRSWAHCW